MASLIQQLSQYLSSSPIKEVYSVLRNQTSAPRNQLLWRLLKRRPKEFLPLIVDKGGNIDLKLLTLCSQEMIAEFLKRLPKQQREKVQNSMLKLQYLPDGMSLKEVEEQLKPGPAVDLKPINNFTVTN